MSKKDIVRKLTSRKLWVAIVGVVVGLAAAFGIDGNEYAEVAGIVTAAVSVVTYVFGEAKVDAAGAMPINLHIDEGGTVSDLDAPQRDGERAEG